MTTTGKIVIVGGGVTGLTTGVALLEAGWPVHLVAAEIPGPTSVAAGAMWGPYMVEPWTKVRRWSLVSLDVFRELSGAPVTGVRMVSGVEAARNSVSAPEWSTLLPDFRECSPGELPAGFVGGFRFTVPLIDMPLYLQYLLERFRGAGGTVRRQFVGSLDEIDDGSVIVNCAGLGAGKLAADDGVRPIRGQHVVVKNPGITEFFSEDTGPSSDLVCIYPHGETVILGGTAIDGEASLQEDPVAARAIVERCAAVEPRLAKAPVVASRVGARPTRSEVRVEADSRSDGVPVLHNYGHGGSGVTLSWGCAREIVGMLPS
ncbi:amino acid oxidase [Streptomyces viridochromogenes]|uniref:FAD-dependent oxidoreductase n=1 Tax=Streptomyces viridochromogenes TaxID=1938 RepID=UPI00069E9571|nr:FAD-dependent oxidoreductase [Streptomyces viridochromogenes]KOG29535.1 amino acid oxidase [Streptomyces viridochromogenes]